MRHLSLILVLLGAALGAENAPPATGWSTDLPAALARAKEEHRLVLVHFSGSDWNPWCLRLQGEVFSRKPFQAYAQERLVLVNVDFPRATPLPQEIAVKNAALVAQYGVTIYPTLLLLTPGAGELGRFAYMQGGPKTFVRELQRLASLPQPAAQP